MYIDDKTKYLLDFAKVLSDLQPSSPFGNKCKSAMKPYTSNDAEKLAQEFQRVEEMKGLIQSQPEIIREIKANLKQIKDILRSVERCMAGGVLSQIELFELKSLIFIMYSIHCYQRKLLWIIDESYKVYELPKVMELLDPKHSGIRSFYIYDDYSEKLTQIRIMKSEKEKALEILKKKEIERVEEIIGVKLKSTGELIINKNQDELIRQIDSCGYMHQTGESYINLTYKIKSSDLMSCLIEDIEELKGEELIEEAKVLEQISDKLAEHGEDIISNINAIGKFDFLCAKGELALRYNGVKPKLLNSRTLNITNGINPIVQKELKKSGKKYMPISVELSEGVTLITGANMGGKTVSLKLIGLLICMAQHGLLVPAENMSFGIFDFIYISCGDEQSVDLGLSTFGAEIKGITEVISKADQKGLVLMDELARGTNPKEGYAISHAIIDYLMKKPCISVITSHLEGLNRTGIRHLQVKGLDNIDFSNIKDYKDISEYMDYSLVEVVGKAGIPQDAIKISRIMGMPEEIISHAEWIMKGNKEQ